MDWTKKKILNKKIFIKKNTVNINFNLIECKREKIKIIIQVILIKPTTHS